MLDNEVLSALKKADPFAVIGHRGAKGQAPENSLDALYEAIRSSADIAEFDVQTTRDGVLVASHDPIVTCNDGKRVNIRSANYREVLECAEESRIPRIEDVLSEARGRIGLFLEIKDPSDAAALVKLVREHHALIYVAIISFHEDALRTVKMLEPQLPTGIIYFKPPGKIVDCKKISCSIVLPRYPLATARAVSLAHRLGLYVVAWTVNSESTVWRLWENRVDGIATDYPAWLVALREKVKERGRNRV